MCAIVGGTCGVDCVLGYPPSVVVLRVSVVYGVVALWVSPSEVLGYQCLDAAIDGNYQVITLFSLW